ncbi:HopJ type III effector protein [Colwellia sp. E2M01]|uniref:HopJ type III effector protein n=1 Tax=Colwellia sp. E2M01 TaxID=2841561 RepID=UPI001C09A924|nr:HopJ type III effector protein [Colwellia sp. E2M01]MBU2871556.1 HopJ type III effector protein [Colwellia sp. E2M01]
MSSADVKTNVTDLINQLDTAPESVSFEQVMQVISDNYNYTPTTFTNGDVANEAGTNEGSCKIFYFAKLNALTAEQTLACFAQYYREDVLKHPEATDHGNIRNFIKFGWDKVEFNSAALTPLV